MQVSRDRWGSPSAWREKQHTEPDELSDLLSLALLEHEGAQANRTLLSHLQKQVHHLQKTAHTHGR